MYTYKTFENQEEASSYSASLVVEAAKSAIQKNGIFTMVLTGGSSPLKLHSLLTEDRYKNEVDWEKTQIFWGDERFVNYESNLSNTRMAYETLLDSLPIPSENIHPMISKTQDIALTSVEKVAREYEQVIIKLMGKSSVSSLDLVFLGMGADGHTASWFPNTEVVHENQKLVSTSYNKEQKTERITLTPPLVLEAKQIVPLVFGQGKAATLKEVAKGSYNPDKLPVQLLRNAKNEVLWVLDKASASLLESTD